MLQLIAFVDWLLGIYVWIVIGNVILSWLIVLKVVNMHNRVVYAIGDTLHTLTEPVLRRIRSVLPALGGLDLSPAVLLIAIVFVREVLLVNLAAQVSGF